MIRSLRGRVIDREVAFDGGAVAELVIEVAGVGYRVFTTPATVSRLVLEGETVLHIHHLIREADQRLYGFATKQERAAFEALLSAHGVGPALALAVLATHPVPQLARILAEDDLDALCQVPGVGRKTAQRLLVELKATVVLPVLDGSAGPQLDLTGGVEPDSLADVREALASLGYSSAEIRKALVGLPPPGDGSDAGQLLKQALLNLSG